MKALSIQQPWAWAILYAGKDIENRSWWTGVRERILIHAGKKIDKEGWEWIEGRFGLTIPRDIPTGGIVGSVELTHCVKYDQSPWFFGPFGFTLKDPMVLNFRPMRGQLGFFQVEGITA